MSQAKQVKDASDIVQIIGERVELKRSGVNYKGLCPFHSEKSPSFFVNEQLQRYRCFGCGESGDVFNFLEKYEGMSFYESLKYLADRAGIELKDYQATPQDEQRERLLDILDLTKEYYHYLLTTHPAGEPAREYLHQRGIVKESIKIFQMGYALPGWDGLIKYLHQKKKYSLADLEAAGLIIKGRNGRYYDRFRDRVMFPLTNARGQIVGFSGRTLKKDVKEAKYINSPETMLYHKSELLFGYSQLYQHIRQAQEVIVAEGELDVISSTQAHVNQIVAIKGSALTREQLQLLRRTVKKVLLSLDMDSAGREATKRAITLAREFEIELRVLKLPSGKDPDELAKTDPKAWREATKTSVSVYEFFLQNAVNQYGTQTPEGKRQIIDELAPIFGSIPHAVEQDFYIKKLAQVLGVKDEVVRKDIDTFKDKTTLFASSKKAATSVEPVEKDQPQTRRERLESYILFLFFRMPFETHRVSELKNLRWKKIGVKPLVQTLEKQSSSFDLTQFMKQLPEDQQQLVSEVYLQPDYIEIVDELDLEKEWDNTLKDLKALSVAEAVAQITHELDQLDAKAEKTPQEEARQSELLKQIVLLKRKN